MKHLFRKLLFSGSLAALCLGFMEYTSRGPAYGIVVGSGILILFVIIAFAMEKLFKLSDERRVRTEIPPNIKQAKRALVIIGLFFLIAMPIAVRSIFPHLPHQNTQGMYLMVAFLELFMAIILTTCYISLSKSKTNEDMKKIQKNASFSTLWILLPTGVISFVGLLFFNPTITGIIVLSLLLAAQVYRMIRVARFRGEGK